MSARQPRAGFRVGGDPRDRRLPSLGAALSLAITLMARAEDERSAGIFNEDNDLVGRVRRDADGTITVERIRL